MSTTKIIEEVSIHELNRILSRYTGKIVVGPHALDILSDAQRKVFKDEDLLKILVREKPKGVGLQKNGRYAVFYRRKEGFMRLILGVKENRLEIITFMNTDTMPNLERLK
jgi:hypothetical protein